MVIEEKIRKIIKNINNNKNIKDNNMESGPSSNNSTVFDIKDNNNNKNSKENEDELQPSQRFFLSSSEVNYLFYECLKIV